jgi:hypothetical protein
MKRLDLRQLLLGGLLAVAAMAVGASLTSTPPAYGEVNGSVERPAFQTGGQLSVPVLKDISATLRQIDARLARLETVAQRMQAAAASRGATADTN